MKFLIVLVAFFAVALAAHHDEHHHEEKHHHNDVKIIHNDLEIGKHNYKFIVETSDGKLHKEEGELKDVDSKHPAMVVHGLYKWKDEKTGHEFKVDYVADEHGFQPVGGYRISKN